MIDRRCLLLSLSVAALGLGFTRRSLAFALTGFSRNPAAANPEHPLARPGLQLYTVRDALAEDFEGTLAKVSELGFREVEIAFSNRSAEEIGRALESAGLTAPSTMTLLQPLRTDLDRLLDDCRRLGHRYLVLGYLLPAERRTLDDYRELADFLDTTGERCREAGVQLAYHNHDFEFLALGDASESAVPYDLLLDRCDPKLVQMELDLYWIHKADADPFGYFERWPGRFPLLHVKDMDGTEARDFTEVGSGVIDFASIFEKAELAGVRHLFVEQDTIRGSIWDSLRKSLDHLQSLEVS